MAASPYEAAENSSKVNSLSPPLPSLGYRAAVLQGSGFINIHVGQYGCEDICLSIIEKQEYLIKQGESSGQLIVIRKIVRLYKECELPDLVFVASLIYLILYLVFLLLLYKHTLSF